MMTQLIYYNSFKTNKNISALNTTRWLFFFLKPFFAFKRYAMGCNIHNLCEQTFFKIHFCKAYTYNI